MIGQVNAERVQTIAVVTAWLMLQAGKVIYEFGVVAHVLFHAENNFVSEKQDRKYKSFVI